MQTPNSIFRWRSLERCVLVIGLLLSIFSIYSAKRSNDIAELARQQAQQTNAILTCLETALPGRIALREDISSFRRTVLQMKNEFDQNIRKLALDVNFGLASRALEIEAQRLFVNQLLSVQGLRSSIPGSLPNDSVRLIHRIIDGSNGAQSAGNRAVKIIEDTHEKLLAAANMMQKDALSDASITDECVASKT